jgi:hypothetical protein
MNEIIEPIFLNHIKDCRVSMIGLRVSISSTQDKDSLFIRKRLFGGGLKRYMAILGQYIIQMFEQLSGESRKSLCLYCCNGSHCHGDDPGSRIFFQCIPGEPMDDKVTVWLKLGRDEAFVMNTDPPSNDAAHWRVIEKLG